MSDSSRVEDLFSAAVELPQDRREAYLHTACGDDREILRRVRRLLDCYDRGSRLFETPPLAAAELESSDLAGAIIGPYRLVRKLGAGGMGAVWLAERADQQFRKSVAIKLIKRGMDTDEILRRFRTERQVLARLEHPSIARLLDGGTTPDGRPYLVMEYVEGLPINQHCDANHLTTRRRLELFRVVCSAVQYAHQNLVIHRDLKPANILVKADGQPRLLDFGIARLLASDENNPTLPATTPGLRLLTPEYASPEQLNGGLVGVPSDVYSLGVILHELLTGHRPSPERRPELSTDLATIVTKAMQSEPQRRYASAEQLSEDIRRVLTDLPILARPDDWTYRASKFIVRRKAAVAATLLIFLTLIGGILTTTWQARNAIAARDAEHRQRLRADEEAHTARRTTDFLVEIFNVSDPNISSGRTITARELLDRGSERLKTELNDQPLVAATLMDTIGAVYQNLGLYDSSAPLLEQALKLRSAHSGESSAEVATSLEHLAALKGETGQPAAAEELQRRSVAVWRQLRADPDPDLARAEKTLATILHQSGKVEEAERAYLDAIAQFRKLEPANSPALLGALSGLAVIHYDRRKLPEAESVWRETLAMNRQLHRGPHGDVATDLNNLSMALKEQGKLDEAEPLAREALDMNRALYGPKHNRIAGGLNNLAAIARARNNLDQAEQLYRESLDLCRESLGEKHAATAGVLMNLGGVLQAKGDLKTAEDFYRRAVAARVAALGPNHQDVAVARYNLAELLTTLSQFAEAETLYAEAADACRKAYGPRHPGVSSPLLRIAEIRLQLRDFPGAEQRLLSWFEQYGAAPEVQRPARAHAADLLARLYEQTNRPDDATRWKQAETAITSTQPLQ